MHRAVLGDSLFLNEAMMFIESLIMLQKVVNEYDKIAKRKLKPNIGKRKVMILASAKEQNIDFAKLSN